ncbi:hypothetical protein SH2C18_31500 [Clostridium sediminicola]|uniref:TetR/AcrR family transcriptional regulator n=1 Tax=Clostridium sediminicola TaxID=3114879 RepID=UPI0031F22653
MPPKTKFNKENIIEAAFEIAKEKGLTAITTRSVATRLGCSVAPIYVNFETIENLIESVVMRVFAISDELLAKQEGPHIFRNIGKASLEFARKYPVFFRELTMQPNKYMTSYEKIEKTMLEAMAEDQTMSDWTLDERKRLFFKMRAFQMGLSAMVANGHVPSWLNDKDVEELLMEVGEELLLVQKLKRREK